MAKQKFFPEQVDDVGNPAVKAGKNNKDLDYSGLGVDGEERITYSSEPFCQGPESGFDEFH
jgi:hypothetical protein